MTEKSVESRSLVVLFLLSGACNLIFEIVWARMLNLIVGVTVFAVSAVVAAFMLGLSVGSVAIGARAQRSRSPMRLFAWLHVGLCLGTLLVLVLASGFEGLYLYASRLLAPSPYALRTAVFVLSLLFLIVPTSLMGATFPVAIEALGTRQERLAKDVGLVYSVSTLGGVIGCVMTVFFLLEALGMRGTLLAAAATELAIGLAAFALDRGHKEARHEG